MNTHPSYETERLYLIPTSLADARFIIDLFNSPKWVKFVGERNVHTEEHAKEYIAQKMTPQLEKLGFGNYTVVRKSDNAKMGSCGLYDRAGLEGIDIGFAFLPEFEGQGYAYEASQKLMQLAFEKFGIKQLSAITLQDNLSSQKLIERLGMQFVEIITIPGDDEALKLYIKKIGNE